MSPIKVPSYATRLVKLSYNLNTILIALPLNTNFYNFTYTRYTFQFVWMTHSKFIDYHRAFEVSTDY